MVLGCSRMTSKPRAPSGFLGLRPSHVTFIFMFTRRLLHRSEPVKGLLPSRLSFTFRKETLPLTSHWPALCHVDGPSCKGSGERADFSLPISAVVEGEGELDYG